MILRAAYNDGRGAEWLAERTKLPIVVLPFTVGGNEQAKDLFGLFDDTVQRLLKAAAMTPEAFDWHILLPALLAGLLVLATHVPLGAQVLARGIVFIDLAIAQIAGIGVIAADALGLEPQGWAVQVSALAAALLGALVLTWTERRWPRDPGGADRRVRSCSPPAPACCCWPATRMAASISRTCWSARSCGCRVRSSPAWPCSRALVLALWFGLRERLGRMGFYLLFALAVTASVQLVGVYLVFTSLIVPALAVRRLRPACGCRSPMRIGALGYAAGAGAVGAVRPALRRGGGAGDGGDRAPGASPAGVAEGLIRASIPPSWRRTLWVRQCRAGWHEHPLM